MYIYGIFIGINRYQDQRIPALRFAANDARTLRHVFTSGVRCETALLINEQATAREIRQTITQVANRATRDDTVILYFSGHGAAEEIEDQNSTRHTDFYLVTHDADRDDLESTALSMDIDIPRFFRRLKARNVILLIDSCYSGEAGGRTFPIRGASFKNLKLLLPETVDSITGRGRIIVSAAAPDQLAFEDERLQHGIFTHYVIDALKGRNASNRGFVTFSDLFNHVSQNVPQKAQELAGRVQQPFYKGEVEEEIKFPMLTGTGFKTLLDFPYAFSPMVVVVGDRRELPKPTSAGDLFAYSASPTDLTWIYHLGLPRNTDVVSDKIFINADEEYLKERFGQKNLLVIGSPASNLFARIVNNSALFRFQINPETADYAEAIAQKIQEIKHNRLEIERFALDSTNQENLRYYMNQFRRGGFLDPTKPQATAGTVTPPDRDYGVVTLCKNPYADSAQFVSILAAGVHLPGTMHAVKMLSTPETSFQDRPLGGILAVNLFSQHWETRLVEGVPEWSTEVYIDPSGLIDKFKKWKDQKERRPAEMTERVINDCIEFIDALKRENL